MDILNLRYRNNAWRPVPGKEKLYNTLEGSWLKIWLHVQDDINNYIGLNTDYELRLINPGTGTSILIKTYTGDVDVVFLKRFMIVASSDNLDRYLYKDDEYNLISIPSAPRVKLYADSSMLYETEQASSAEAIVGKYRAKLDDLTNEENGIHTGQIMYRVAYRLYDGSYVMHTVPDTVLLGGNLRMLLEKGGGDIWSVKFYASKLKTKLLTGNFSSIDTDIITDIAIFVSKNEILYDFDTETFDDDRLEEANTEADYTSTNFDEIFSSVSADFKKLADSPLWYKVYEISIKDIQESEEITMEEVIDMKEFYSDYATRETLDIDQFSHHDLSAEITKVYNSRLIVTDVETAFGTYTPYYDLTFNYPSTARYTFDSNRDTYFLFTIKTDDGTRYALSHFGNLGFATKDGEPVTKKYFLVPPLLGYPDSRAVKCEIIARTENTGDPLDLVAWYIIASYTLKKSKHGNYAYNHSDNFDIDPAGTENNFPWRTEYTEFSNMVYLTDYADNSMKDANRVQLSEVNNPFFFPAENSYQVGTGKIRDIGANTEPLSTGQFGEHPLQVFTSKGVWALLQGQGDVVFSNIIPSSSQVVKEGSRILAAGEAVIFQSEKGWVYALAGRDIRHLSKPLDNPVPLDFLDNPNFAYFTDHTKIVQLSDNLDGVSFQSYLSGSLFGFDKENNELVITNDSYTYSYIFSFDSGYWSRVTGSYSVLVNNYPFLEGLDTDGLHRLSSETGTSNVPVLFVTRDQSLDYNEIYKKLDRSLMRLFGNTESNKNIGYYVFGSDDLYNFQLTAGNDRKYGNIKDVRASRSHKKWKYYIFVLAAELSTDSILTFLDTQFTLKANKKLR